MYSSTSRKSIYRDVADLINGKSGGHFHFRHQIRFAGADPTFRRRLLLSLHTSTDEYAQFGFPIGVFHTEECNDQDLTKMIHAKGGNRAVLTDTALFYTHATRQHSSYFR